MTDLRDTETRDDDAGHGSAIVAAQLAQADDDALERAGIDPDDGPTAWRCPDCGEVRKTYDGQRPDADCLTCGTATEWVPEDREVRCDGGGEGFYWDDADCPNNHCNGTLQQQDFYNVLCLECDDVFQHMKTEDEHWLVTSDFETVVQVPKSKPASDETTGDSCGCLTGRMQSSTPSEWVQMGAKTKVVDRVVLSLLKDLNTVPKTVWSDELSKATDGMSQLRSTLENRMFEEHTCDIADTSVFYGTGNIESATIRLDKSGIHIENISYKRTNTRGMLEEGADQ
ncbi:hypothetical protein [Natrinema thermotolerans]|uniref:hypothetical protein n=1 Tax=Natrinema thermotolerans TaxID=121872 RepID=UPI0006799FB4|nr:hypothetical protein [Natrinema thermotolerans]QCC57272.1 hypothetical protein DVR14_00940 [Natrinema thermotolerans]